MLFAVWVTLLALSVALLALGQYVNDDAYRLTAFLFLFILGTILMSNSLFSSGLELKIGENRTTNYSYLTDNTTINQTSMTIDYNYSGYQNTTFGLFMALAGAFGMIITFMHLRKSRDDE